MAEPIIYRQCAMVRGTVQRVSWIPQKYAEVGKQLRLRDNGVWTEWWEVTSVGASRDDVPHVPGLIRQHERATGDSDRKPKSVIGMF